MKCPKCGHDIPSSAGKAQSPPHHGPEHFQGLTIRRVACPHCGEPLIRAARDMVGAWESDRLLPQ